MTDQQPKDSIPGGILHRLTHRIPGVPAHDGTRGLRHQGRARQGGRPSLNDRLNGRLSGKLNAKAAGEIADERGHGAHRPADEG